MTPPLIKGSKIRKKRPFCRPGVALPTENRVDRPFSGKIPENAGFWGFGQKPQKTRFWAKKRGFWTPKTTGNAHPTPRDFDRYRVLRLLIVYILSYEIALEQKTL